MFPYTFEFKSLLTNIFHLEVKVRYGALYVELRWIPPPEQPSLIGAIELSTEDDILASRPYI